MFRMHVSKMLGTRAERGELSSPSIKAGMRPGVGPTCTVMVPFIDPFLHQSGFIAT